MAVLTTLQRNTLEKAVIKARITAEEGAINSLKNLAVDQPEPFQHQSSEQRALRNNLRAKARLLGDVKLPNGSHEIQNLAYELAYEYWHKILFARFLEANNLLMHPTMGVAVALDEMAELAPEEGYADKWDAAASYASKMLPAIFRVNDPLMQVKFAPDDRIALESILNALTPEIFTADDALGWVYQFWQTEAKKAINESGDKIDGKRLPAVTQLFTEPYMVNFLIDNTLGAWWVGRNQGVTPPYRFEYLRVPPASSRSNNPPYSLEHLGASPASSRSNNQYEFFNKDEDIDHIKGNLPHWRQEGKIYFVTFRTADSLPQEKLKAWQEELEAWNSKNPEPHSPEQKMEYYKRFPAKMQEYLDNGYGACHLRDEKVKVVVENALKFFDDERYILDEFVVAANHVHVLVQPKADYQLSDILHSWKSFTANEINKITGESGAFWQKESFDHLVRSEASLEKFREYIGNHKVAPASSGSEDNFRQDGGDYLFPESDNLCKIAPASSGSEDNLRQDGGDYLFPESDNLCKVAPASSGSEDNFCQDGGDYLFPESDNLCKVAPASSGSEDNLRHPGGVSALRQDGGATLFPESEDNLRQDGGVSALRQDGGATLYPGWPDKTAEITALDPCMGSGHFVCSLFNVFAALRMHEEGLTKEQATDRVISENLHGLEIDPRCTQIAAFNLALTAWKFCGHYKELPEMNLACSGIAPKGKVEDWVKLVGKVERPEDKERFENGMRELYNHFQLAPELGSLLDPSTIKADVFTASFEQLQPALKKALENERDNEVLERGVMAAGIAKAGEILSKKYWLQITNVPYLGKGKFDKALTDYVLKHYMDAKGDLANVFLERLFKTAQKSGIVNTVIPQNWLFLTTYKKHREKLLKNETWNFVARLGPGAFSQISGEVVKAILISLSHAKAPDTHSLTGLDVSDATNAAEKDAALKTAEIKTVNQKEQLGNPSHTIVFESLSTLPKICQYADSTKGTDTGDDPHFSREFWEVEDSSMPMWMKYHSTPNGNNDFDGKTRILFWEDEKGDFVNNSNGTIRKRDTLSINSIAIRLTGKIEAALFSKALFDTNAGAIVPKKSEYLLPLFTFCRTNNFHEEVRKLDQALKATNAVISKVPFDLAHWQKVAAEKYPNGLPKPYSDDPTQWLFHGHPVKAENALQVAVARLLGYRWPAESDEEMDLSEEARELIKQVKELQLPFDEDGIVCITPVYGEQPAAERLRQLLQKTWGDKWSNSVLADLLKQAGSTKTNLEDWLRDEFFANHCKVFQNRPFVWHIWDGRKDGFSALVNYHKLDKEALKKLIYTYLGDWIRQCEAKRKAGESGADGLLSAALKLKEKLELILVGEQPYDIFVRWKKLEDQPIGWEPDLNDGVRLNIRPFVEAGVLRSRFNIKWGIDRGKNPAGSPWGEIRDNDRHLSLEEKSAKNLSGS